MSAEARAWALKAHVAEDLGDIEEAERALQWVLRLERAEPASWVLWGLFLERQVRHTEAAEAFESALERDAHHGPAHKALGDLLARAERFEEAVVHLEAALTAGVSGDAFEVLARLYKRMDLSAEHQTLIDRWLLVAIDDADERLVRAQSTLAAERPDDAMADLLYVVERRDDPLAAELLVEAALRACRLGTTLDESRRLGLDADPAYSASMARLLEHAAGGTCGAVELQQSARAATPCEARALLLRAREAAPLLSGLAEELSSARHACETAGPEGP